MSEGAKNLRAWIIKLQNSRDRPFSLHSLYSLWNTISCLQITRGQFVHVSSTQTRVCMSSMEL